MRTLVLILASLSLAGCQYDPHAHLYTTSEPKTQDVVGTYVLDALHLPPEVGNARPNVTVELRADGTFVATNVPPWELDGPGTDFFTSLLSGSGKWEKSTHGILDPGQKDIWGVYLRTPDNRFHPANFTGDKPPYGLIFTLGDPDSGHAVILKKSNDVGLLHLKAPPAVKHSTLPPSAWERAETFACAARSAPAAA